MKPLYESLLTGKVPKPRAKVRPSSRDELAQIINEHIKKIEPRPGQEVDLDWIDISDVDDLSELFAHTDYIPVINTWKIDRVKDFYYMFAYNEHIVRSPLPRLQKKLLRRECYGSMFYGCTSLVESPALPATELTDSCYAAMFYDCTALEVVPVLPATDLTNGCYAYMFAGCVSLKEPPALQATELAPNCYTNMFTGCTALTRTPTLPAIKLTPYCYSGMFWGCSSLKVALELPATKLAVDCYYAMFKNCDNLKAKAKMPPEVNLDRSAAQSMYAGCPCDI